LEEDKALKQKHLSTDTLDGRLVIKFTIPALLNLIGSFLL